MVILFSTLGIPHCPKIIATFLKQIRTSIFFFLFQYACNDLDTFVHHLFIDLPF